MTVMMMMVTIMIVMMMMTMMMVSMTEGPDTVEVKQEAKFPVGQGRQHRLIPSLSVSTLIYSPLSLSPKIQCSLLTSFYLGEHRRGPSHGGGEEGGHVSCRGGTEGQQQ